MSQLITTLNKIRSKGPCEEGWTKLLAFLGKTQADDEPLAFSTILEANGLDDALWCRASAPEYSREWRLFGVWCAKQVQHLMTDQRSLTALEVAERHAYGLASDAELDAAWDAAWAATRDAAWAAARDAAWAAAWAAARDAARDAAWAAARAAARGAAWAAQAEAFKRLCNGEDILRG